MKRNHRQIVSSWVDSIRNAIRVGDADAAYRLTRALIGRLRELGLEFFLDSHRGRE